MTVNILSEFGGAYDDSYTRVIAVYSDRAAADTLMQAYHTKMRAKQIENERAYNAITDDTPYDDMVRISNDYYAVLDYSGVRIDIYELDAMTAQAGEFMRS
jgi:hypothetical protein